MMGEFIALLHKTEEEWRNLYVGEIPKLPISGRELAEKLYASQRDERVDAYLRKKYGTTDQRPS